MIVHVAACHPDLALVRDGLVRLLAFRGYTLVDAEYDSWLHALVLLAHPAENFRQARMAAVAVGLAGIRVVAVGNPLAKYAGVALVPGVTWADDAAAVPEALEPDAKVEAWAW